VIVAAALVELLLVGALVGLVRHTSRFDPAATCDPGRPDRLGQLPADGARGAADRARRRPLLAERDPLLGHDRGGRERLKRYEPPPGSGGEVARKDAIVGALALYADFVGRSKR
jgi:hypothetical protein